MSSSLLTQLFRRQLSNEYHVGKVLGEGGYGITFLAREKSNRKRKVVIKLPSLDLERDREDLKERLAEFNHTLDAECEGLSRLHALRSVGHVLSSAACMLRLDDESLRVPYIVQEYVSGEDLDSYLASSAARHFINVRKTAQNQPYSGFGGIKDPEIFFRLASKIIVALASVHRHEVVHGDLWPPNIRINGAGEPIIIDFGQSLLADLVFLAEAKPIVHPYAAPERRHSQGQWSTAADIYSLGGILFFMASGDPPPDPIEDREDLKIEVCERIRLANPDLHLANSGIADVIARCLRYDDRDRPAFAEGVLEELSIFMTAPRRRSPQLKKSIKFLGMAVDRLEKGHSEVFATIASAQIRTLTHQLREMSDGLYTLGGHNENIIRGMVDCLSLLEKSDSYLTVSVPSFWGTAPNGLGINGRFLEMNKVAAQNGVSIGRVFLLTEEEMRSEMVHKILKAHWRIVQELRDRKPKIATEKTLVAEKRQGYYAGIRKLDNDLRRELDVTNFGVWTKSKQNQDVLIVPQYREREKEIAAVRFWAPVVARKRIAKHKEQALKLVQESTPLEEFLSTITRPSDELRQSVRRCGDERTTIKAEATRKSTRGTLGIEPLSATVINYSRDGMCLRVLTALRRHEVVRGRTKIRLLKPCPFAGTWAQRFWGSDLKVIWMSDPSLPPWRLGLKKV